MMLAGTNSRGSLGRALTGVARLFAGCGLLLAATAVAAQPADDWKLNRETRDFSGVELEEVVAALSDKDAGVRFSAVRELGRRGFAARGFADRLIEILAQDPEAGIRATAAEVLPRLGGDEKKTQAALRKALDDTGHLFNFPPVWLAAAQSLGKHYGPESLDLMLSLLAKNDAKSVGAACGAIMEWPPELASKATEPLLQIIADDNDDLRIFAVMALGAATEQPDKAAPVLEGLIKHRDLHTQYWACQSLAKFGPRVRRSVPALIEALQEGPASVRRHAALALGAIGSDGDEAVQALAQAIVDPLQPVRRDALIGLGMLGDAARSALPKVEEALNTKAYNPRSYAALAMYQISGKREQPLQVLVQELQDSTATEAVEVLAMIGAELKAAPELVKLLEHDNTEVRYFAMEALGTMGAAAQEALPALRKLAENEQERDDLREVARETIAVIEAAAGK